MVMLRGVGRCGDVSWVGLCGDVEGGRAVW